MPAWSTSYPARALRRLRAFDWEQRRIAAAAVVVLPVLHFTARVGGLRSIRRLLRVGAVTADRPDAVAVGKHLATPIGVTADHIRLDQRSCVARATFLWWLLRRRAIPAEVVIGSHRVDGRFEAHAWVEVDGQPVDDTPDVRERFAVLEGRPIMGGGSRTASP
jgi:hypothetical protein